MTKPVPEQKDHSQIYEMPNRVSRSTIAVIDTVVQRGGFKGEELTTIGTLRDQQLRLFRCVKLSNPNNPNLLTKRIKSVIILLIFRQKCIYAKSTKTRTYTPHTLLSLYIMVMNE